MNSLFLKIAFFLRSINKASKRMMTQMDGAGVFAPIVVLSLMAVIFAAILAGVEKKYMGWRKE